MEFNENDIAQYLEENPDFFKNHVNLLATMYLPNAHGGGTVSLAERQQAAQRDKIRQTEQKYSELLQIGIENDAIGTKMHQLALSLLQTSTLDDTVNALTQTLQNDFNVPMVTLKIWTDAGQDHETSSDADEQLQAWLETLPEPYCGSQPDESIRNITNGDAKSYAVCPLKNPQIFGIVIMASDNEKRFYPEMGTMFIERIGELVSAAIEKYIA
jgi:uncharacterized protein YigA (DUF484 family)